MTIPPINWPEIIKQLVQRLFVVVFYVNSNKKTKRSKRSKRKKRNQPNENVGGDQ